jgi:hypothetical protein
LARVRERMRASGVCKSGNGGAGFPTRSCSMVAASGEHWVNPKRLTFSVVGFKPAALDRRRDEVEL